MEPRARQFKDEIYGQFARIGKALAAPKRIELLELLAQCPRTVEELAALAGISLANASQHLRVLRAAHLVAAEKKGLHVECRLASAEVGGLLLTLRGVAEGQLAEVGAAARAFWGAGDKLEAVDAAELRHRIRTGEVTLLDVRPLREFEAGHLPGAISMPLADLRDRTAELPRGREIVAYCRGPYCVMAAEAVAWLRSQGFSAHRLGDSVLDWRAAEARGAGKAREASHV